MSHPVLAEEYVTLIHAATAWQEGYKHFSVTCCLRPEPDRPTAPMLFHVEIKHKERKGGVVVARPSDPHHAMFLAARMIDRLDDLADEIMVGYGAPRG
jgi:hypothetical protein